MAKTNIDWADMVWNPVTGCSKVSPGCDNCYAERQAKRLQGMPATKEKYKNGFAVTCHPEEIYRSFPGKGKKIFVCSMSDLFHEDVPFYFICEVMDVIESNKQHTFIVLTKRPERMKEFFDAYKAGIDEILPNLWLGVTAENQEQANKRIPVLLSIPAVVRLVSVEPMLEKISLSETHLVPAPAMRQILIPEFYSYIDYLDWVIVGGESGSKARPMNPEWVRSIQQQCEAASVPFFFKQWGGKIKREIKENGFLLDGKAYREFPDSHK